MLHYVYYKGHHSGGGFTKVGTGFHSHCHQCHSISLSFVILYFLNSRHITDTLNSIFCYQNLSIIASIWNASTRKKCLTSIGSFLTSLGFIQPKKQSNLKSNIFHIIIHPNKLVFSASKTYLQSVQKLFGET